MAGILTAGAGDTISVALSSGVTVSGALSSGSASALNGRLVQVSSPARGKLSVSALGSSDIPGDLDAAAGTLGELELSPDVTVYDQVKGSGAVEVALSDILTGNVNLENFIKILLPHPALGW